MPAGSTYTPLASTTLGSDSANITFSSIAGTYTDLILVVGNLETASTGQGLKIRFNSDTGTNYSYTTLYGTGTTAASFTVSSATSGQIGWAGVGSTANKTNVIASIQNYSNTTTNKTVISRSNDAAAETTAIVNLWRSTSAITNIQIFASSGNLRTGTMATLYGIASA